MTRYTIPILAVFAAAVIAAIVYFVEAPSAAAQLGCVTIAPICPPGQHPVCICPGYNGRCYWQCSR